MYKNFMEYLQPLNWKQKKYFQVSTIVLSCLALIILTLATVYLTSTTRSLAPNAPASQPLAASSACTSTIVIATPTPTPTPIPSCTFTYANFKFPASSVTKMALGTGTHSGEIFAAINDSANSIYK